MATKKPDLKAELKALEQKESQLIADIQQQEAEIKDAKIALQLVEKPLPVPVVAGVLVVFDSLKTLTDGQESETAKQLQIDNFKSAVLGCESNLERLNSELLQLKSDIVKVKEDIDFETNYLPHFQNLKTGYTKRSDALKNREKSALNDLARYKSERDSLELFFAGKKVSLHFLPMGANPDVYLQRLTNEYIPQKQRELENIQSVEITDTDLLADKDFIAWLKARVSVDSAVNELVKSQAKYLEDLKLFKSLAKNNAKGLDFAVDSLPYELNTVSIVDEKIGLSKVNL